MRLILFTVLGKETAIVANSIQAVQEGSGERQGKADILLARLSNEVDDVIHTDQTFREAQMMLINCDL